MLRRTVRMDEDGHFNMFLTKAQHKHWYCHKHIAAQSLKIKYRRPVDTCRLAYVWNSNRICRRLIIKDVVCSITSQKQRCPHLSLTAARCMEILVHCSHTSHVVNLYGCVVLGTVCIGKLRWTGKRKLVVVESWALYELKWRCSTSMMNSVVSRTTARFSTSTLIWNRLTTH
jgi:hypothetical protein